MKTPEYIIVIHDEVGTHKIEEALESLRERIGRDHKIAIVTAPSLGKTSMVSSLMELASKSAGAIIMLGQEGLPSFMRARIEMGYRDGKPVEASIVQAFPDEIPRLELKDLHERLRGIEATHVVEEKPKFGRQPNQSWKKPWKR